MGNELRFEKVSFTEWCNALNRLSEGIHREALFSRIITDLTSPYGFKNLEDVHDEIILPKRATKYSAGYDFFMPCDITLHPGETITIPTGIKWNPGQHTDCFLAIYPRSSLGRDYCLREPNIVSIIDADYYGNRSNEGHIMINLKNEGTNGEVCLKQGMAYAQGIIQKYFLTVDDDATAIRTGGFGSTNKRKED